MQILKFFDAYANAGLKVIPLYSRSKIPIGKKWYDNWDREACRRSFEQNSNVNIGILLGDIVDVEGDTDEANSFLKELVTNCPHPSYRSSKSIHHLFLNPDPNLTIWTHNSIEFRAYKHQSALPPSRHIDGTGYAWTTEAMFPIPPMPEALYDFYKLHQKKKNVLKPGHIQPWCSMCKHRKYIHKKRYDLECIAFSFLNESWQCHKCRKVDVREACRKIRKINSKKLLK